MTTDRMALIELLEKSADADFLREMLGFVADRLMALEAEGLCGAAPGEYSPERTNRRNGYRDRRWETRAGTVDLVAVVQEAYVQGVSTRSVEELVKAMGMTGISKSQVSRLCAEIDERVSAFLERPIEGFWPYLWLDATYVQVRRGGRIVSAAVIVAVGANAEGRREILGLTVGPSEAEPSWTDFLRNLANRGLRGRQAGDRRRPPGLAGCGRQGLERHRPALPRAFHAQRARLRPQRPAGNGRRRNPHRLRPRGRRGGEPAVASGRRQPAAAVRKTSSAHG